MGALQDLRREARGEHHPGDRRDILADVMRRVHEAGYKVVCHIHDELVIEVPDETHLPTIEAMFSVTPDWAEGLPLRGAGYICDFYYKD